MFLLSENQNNKVVYLLHPRNYTFLYNRLKTLLKPEHYTFFARPDQLTNSCTWTCEKDETNAQKFKKFSELSETEKDYIIDYIENFKDTICKQLSNDKEFMSITQELFIIPSENEIKILRTNNELQPILTQWGCRSSEFTPTIDPITHLIKLPRVNRSRVVIEVFYTNGDIASNKVFYMTIHGFENKRTADATGKFDFGMCSNSLPIRVYDKDGDLPVYVHDFKVASDQKYIVKFPLFSSMTIKVLDQNDTLLHNIPVLFKNQSGLTEMNTGKTGILSIDKLEVGTEVTVCQSEHRESTQTVVIDKGKNEVILKRRVPEYADATIKVIDENDEIQKDFMVLLAGSTVNGEHSTGSEGIIQLEDMLVGSTIQITNPNLLTNTISCTVNKTDNDWILKIVVPKKKFVKVTLLDSNKKPMPNTTIDFEYNQQKITLVSDHEGVYYLPYESFVHGEKVKTNIHLPKKQKNIKQEKDGK